jgi:hypothetical protein
MNHDTINIARFFFRFMDDGYPDGYGMEIARQDWNGALNDGCGLFSFSLCFVQRY